MTICVFFCLFPLGAHRSRWGREGVTTYLLKLSCPAEVDAAVLGAGGVGVPVVDVWA